MNCQTTFDAVLMKGNEAIAEGAIRAGCEAYFGYPITPQSEILEHMSRRMPDLGRAFVQAESELAAVNMVFGASAAGFRAMTSSSSPGVSLMQETLSAMASAQLPAVIVNVMRAGPGIGGILPAQADYFQATRGGGHGDYHLMVLAPASVQEAMDLTSLAFDLADTYQNPVMVLADGLLGQTMEPVTPAPWESVVASKPWALTGAAGRERNLVRTLYLAPEMLEAHTHKLDAVYDAMAAEETRYSTYLLDDADIAIVAYGTASRVARSAVNQAREGGLKVGLFRPISLFPFPEEALAMVAERVQSILVVELSMGQLIVDVRLAVKDRVPVALCNRVGGLVPTPQEAVDALNQLARRW